MAYYNLTFQIVDTDGNRIATHLEYGISGTQYYYSSNTGYHKTTGVWEIGDALTASWTKPSGYSYYGMYSSGMTGESWGTTSGTFTCNGNMTITIVYEGSAPPPATYTISYNNGGHGTAPSSQTKTKGVALTLRSFISDVYGTESYNLVFDSNGGSGGGTVEGIRHVTYTQDYWVDSDYDQYSSSGSYVKNKSTTMTATWDSEITSYDTIRTPSASTKQGYRFVAWNTNSSGTGTDYLANTQYDPSTYTELKSSRTLYARYVEQYSVALSVYPSGSGTVTGSGYYDLRDWVPISASASTGYSFDHWLLDTGEEIRSSSTNLYIKRNRSASAYFTGNQYTVTFDASGGSVSPSTKEVIYGSSYGILPTPTWLHHTFLGWYDQRGTLVTSSSIVYWAKNHTLHAVWEYEQVSVTIESLTGGSTSPSGTSQYQYGSTVNFTAIPDSGYAFDKWYWQDEYDGGDWSTSASSNWIVSGDSTWRKFTAQFLRLYSLDTYSSPPYGGTITLSPSGGSYKSGTRVQLTATPYNGYHFSNRWKFDDGTQLGGNPVSVTVTRDMYATAYFEGNEYTVSFDSHGGSACSPIQVIYGSQYSSVSNLPTPTASGYTFIGWYKTDSYLPEDLVTNSTIVSTIGNHTLHAKWGETYHIQLDPGNIDRRRGTENLWAIQEGSYTYYYTSSSCLPSEQVTSIVIPEKYGYTFNGYIDDTTGDLRVNSSGVIQQRADPIIGYEHWSASWQDSRCTLTIYKRGSGTVTGSGTKIIGSVVEITASPSVGYTFQGWYSNSTYSTLISSNPNYSFTISGNTTIYASFAILCTFKPNNSTYGYVSVNSGDQGSAVIDSMYYKTRLYQYNTNYNITATPYSGCEFVNWTISYQSGPSGIKSTNPTVSGPVTLGFTLNANFKKTEQEIDLSLSLEDQSFSPYVTFYGVGSYPVGTNVVFGCNVSDGYTFVQWSDGSTDQHREEILLVNTSLTCKIKRNTIKERDSADGIYGNKYYVARDEYYEDGEFGWNAYTGSLNPLSDELIGGNCVWYGCGRTSEICERKLIDEYYSWPSASYWYSSEDCLGDWGREGQGIGGKVTGDQIDFRPGDIICYGGGSGTASGYGHVSIVESVDLDNDTMRVSYSSYHYTDSNGYHPGYLYGSSTIRLSTHTVGCNWGSLILQGVIHNPYVSNAEIKKYYNLITNVFPQEAGYIDVTSDKQLYDYVNKYQVEENSLVKLYAKDYLGHEFYKWWDGTSNREKTFTATSDVVVTAFYDGTEPTDYCTITAISNNSELGTVTGGGIYLRGTVVTLVATPNRNCLFDNWSTGETTETLEIVATTDSTYTGYFSTTSTPGGPDIPITDHFDTIYGYSSSIRVDSISIDVTVSEMDEIGNITSSVRPAMTLVVGSNTINIPEDSTGSPYTYSPTDPIQTSEITLSLSSSYTTSNTLNVNSIYIVGNGYSKSYSDGTKYIRYFNGSEWSDWSEMT